MPKFFISDLIIEVIAPEWVLDYNLNTFLCNSGKTDVYFSIVFRNSTVIPEDRVKIIMKNAKTSFYEYEGCFHFFGYDEKEKPFNVVASRNWSDCTVFIDPEYDRQDDEEIAKHVRGIVFNILQMVLISSLINKKGLIIHSSTILLNEQGVVFSAASGVGKTTHTSLWKQLYDVQILDGDVTACRLINGKPYVYGLPWCGTSGEYMNHCAPLRAIVFLEQAKENKIVKMNFQEAFIRLISGCFILSLNEHIVNQCLDTIQEVVTCTDCYLLSCLPDYDAVELVRKCLE